MSIKPLKNVYQFKPIRGLEADLNQVSHTEGAILIATDTGKMWMDTRHKRVPLGGTGVALLYANGPVETLADDEHYYYGIEIESLEDSDAKPHKDDLILNSDGSFYRITNIEDGILYCSRLAVSGSGGGSGTGETGGKAKPIKITVGAEMTELINGQDAMITFTTTSGLDEEGDVLDQNIQVYWKLFAGDSSTSYYENQVSVKTGVPKEVNIGKYLRESTTSRVEIYAHGANSGDTRIKTLTFTTANLRLYRSTQTIKANALQESNFLIYCNVEGNINKLLVYTIDGEDYEYELDADTYGEHSHPVKGLSHGMHTLSINLYQYNNGQKFASAQPIEFEFAVNAGGTDPIIWLGDYKEEYHTYDAIRIPYRVFIPNQSTYHVTLLKDISVIGTREIDKSNTSFAIWEITDAEQGPRNSYTIQVEKTTTLAEGESKYISREINFVITADTSRENFKIQNEDTLLLSFDSAGRSNDETEQTRQTWTYGNYTGKFENFNWYNNGWVLDDDNSSTLRISNGAKFSIDLGSLIFNSPTQQVNQSKTFEFQFKLRNVQDYSNLIKTYTRYTGDDKYWVAFEEQMNDPKGYNNYDTYLKNTLDSKTLEALTDTSSTSSQKPTIIKRVSKEMAFCDYTDSANRGIALGPQDGFFKTPQTTLSVDYVEDKMINMSIVFDYTNKNILIYLQGILTAISAITDTQAFNINTNTITFKSDFCDIDLYKFRVYSSALSVQNILINYAVDHKSVLTYDHSTELITYNQDIGEYELEYRKMLAWNNNEDRANDQLMPYVIFATSGQNDALPYSKATTKKILFTFVNTGLEKAYKDGRLEELASKMPDAQQKKAKEEFPNDDLALVKYYYKHHCPSFTSIEQEVSLDVQGTSSEFYPRRNYKAKTKGSKTILNEDGTTSSEDNIYMYMDKGPFADDFAKGNYDKCQLDFFYYNNYNVGTTKFTMKIDFMESSGTYNMGMANLVHTAYTKHPLDDYNNADAFATAEYQLATDETFNENMTYYADEKGKKKAEVTAETYQPNTVYQPVYKSQKIANTDDLRTNVQGFPVMTFWKFGDGERDYKFIGRYNMLSDKGSDEMYGFKPAKTITAKFLKAKKGVQKAVRKIAECWEYSDNQHSFCSFRDPANHHKLSFDYRDKDGNRVYNAVGSCPVVADSYEYRYNDNEDFLDYVYNPTSQKGQKIKKDLVAAGDYTDAYLDMNTNKEKMADDMLSIYSNWEKACQWVWSTNPDNVPTQEDVNSGKATARLIMKYVSAEGEEYDESVTYYDKYEDEIEKDKVTVIEQEGKKLIGEGVFKGIPSPTQFEGSDVVYEYETREYRLAKFTYELKDHFDLEYCLVYFVMTEALLAYDSRGKNCMMASWGPKQPGGDYIWYPIFYDMDTQLGINNTGIPSFEYSENATKDGTFSTNDSILWNNLYTCFFREITAKYEELSSEMNSKRTQYGPLYHSTIDHIENWYRANPEETGELEMDGARPLAMFNMDEWYKYISICNPKIGYQGQRPNETLYNDKTFYYALQGDRSLSRQQFLTRRLTFLDSWLAVNGYSRAGGGSAVIRTRYGFNNGNALDANESSISDVWVDTDATLPAGKIKSPYYVEGEFDERGYKKKTNYLDGDLFVDLTPYQKSYVTAGTDTEAWVPSLEYDNKPVHLEFPLAQQESVKSATGVAEGLLYIYGGGVIKDIGDVSRLYFSEFFADNCPHISRLLIGNDHPGFYNKLLKTTTSFDAALGEGKVGKPLLKEVNLSHISFKNEGGTELNTNFNSAEKLEIFKAVGSSLPTVKFADGVALHTLYLPRSVAELKLTEANNLRGLISSLGNFSEETYMDEQNNTYYSTYYPTRDEWVAKKGLYIEGLTDVTDDIASSSNNISTIDINGGVLGYASFDLLKRLYNKYKASENKLRVSMKKVDWSPYKKLETDEEFDSTVTYYIDDMHYGLTEYANNGSVIEPTDWDIKLANGVLYKEDLSESANKSKIKNIQMLLDFVATNNAQKQFIDPTTEDESTPYTPSLTGIIYIDNDEEVDEDDIRNILYNPTSGFSEELLDLRFKKVKKGYKAVFVQEENGIRTNTYGTQVIAADSPSKIFDSPYDLYEAKKDNFDFHGWSSSTSVNDVIEADNWSNDSKASAKDGVYDYTYYALFTKHEFAIEFKSGSITQGFVDQVNSKAVRIDGTLVNGVSTTYGEKIKAPDILPSYTDDSLKEAERYTFVGWTQDKNATIVTNVNKAKLIDVNSIRATSDMIFYAAYIKESVFNSVLDDKYLLFTPVDYVNNLRDASRNLHGYSVAFNAKVEGLPGGYNPTDISGKITLPSYHEGLPVVCVEENGFENCSKITHVFFEKDNVLGPCQVKSFKSYAFNSCESLEIVDFPDSLEELKDYAISNCKKLRLYGFEGENLQYIEGLAIHNSIDGTLQPRGDFHIGGSVRYLGPSAISNIGMTIENLYIGSEDHPSELSLEAARFNYIEERGETGFVAVNNGKGPKHIIYYYRSAEDKDFFEDLISRGYARGHILNNPTHEGLIGK